VSVAVVSLSVTAGVVSGSSTIRTSSVVFAVAEVVFSLLPE